MYKYRHFSRSICFGDIHLGLKGDSEQHNKDCMDFIDWLIEKFHENQCDSVIFMGDWFHNQVRCQWDTLWMSNRIIAKLSALNVPVYFIIGNHDMWSRNDRSIHAHPMLHLVPNFHVINSITQVDDCLFCPYLTGAEYNEVASTEAKYIFGHFELPGFLTNEVHAFQKKDGMQDEYFEHPEYVFSGHFHRRQWKKNSNGTNIVYIGNCFPHDYNDVNDRARGCMIFERNVEPKFLDWNGPNYNRIKLSTFTDLMEKDKLMERFDNYSTISVENDISLIDPELTEFREWARTLGFRSITIEPPKTKAQIEIATINAPRQNITDFFISGLNQIDTEGSKFNIDTLKELTKKALEKYDHG